MPSLLDFLGAGGQGLLGSLGADDNVYYDPLTGRPMRGPAFPEMPPAQLPPQANMQAQAPALGGLDPFNFPGAMQAAPAPPAAAPRGPAGFPTGVETPPAPSGAPMQTAPANLPMQAPAAAPAQAPSAARPPDIGDRLGAGLMGFANSGAPLPAVANLLSGLITGQRSDPGGIAQQNAMLAARGIHTGLIRQGYDPEDAKAIALASVADPQVGQALLPDVFGNKPSGQLKLGSLELPYRIEGGQMKLLLPGGGSASSLGDLIAMQQKIEAQGAQSKAAATKIGESQGEARQALPGALQQTDDLIANIDALLRHPAKGSATGTVVGALPALGGDQADYIARLDQLKGALTAEGIRNMQGGGLRITQAEAKLFQQAGGRLERRAGPENIDNALNEIKQRLLRARELSGVKAGVGPTPATSINTPYGMVRQVQ